MIFGTWRWWGRQSHAPAAFTPGKCSWYSFSLGAESTPGPRYGRKEYVTEKSSDTTGNRSRDCPTSSAAPQPLRHPRPPHYIGLLSKSAARKHSLIPNQKYVLLPLTSFNIFDKTAVISLYIYTSFPSTKKVFSKYYDMVLRLLTSQKFWPQINTSYGMETLWKCITFLQVVWSILCNWRGSVAAGKACCWW
jgi:hypothetical protein